MRKSLLLYLFVFTALLAVFLYVSSQQMLEAKTEKIEVLQEELAVAQQLKDSLYRKIANSQSFSLTANEEALTYLEDRGLDPSKVFQEVEVHVISRNKIDADNELIPYAGMDGYFRINKIKLLNHKWLLASFTDGTYWGDLFLTYDFGEDGKLSVNTEQALLYPLN